MHLTINGWAIFVLNLLSNDETINDHLSPRIFLFHSDRKLSGNDENEFFFRLKSEEREEIKTTPFTLKSPDTTFETSSLCLHHLSSS